MFREKFNLELKEKISKSFLKTVSAFANYTDGKIIFGVSDVGEIIGIDSSDKTRLAIEHMINDSFNPRPEYKIESKDIDGKSIIELYVFEGNNKPYYYKNKAFKRYDTSSIEVDRVALNNLILEGMNKNYEELNSSLVSPSFEYLEKYLVDETGIDALTSDILRTLNLINKEGVVNIAGELLSDDNRLSNSVIDIIRFGDNINQILDRRTFANNSVLWQFDQALKTFETYYEYEEITGFKRVKKERIPKEAFREALANSIVHRDWYVDSKIQISMYHDRIEIVSPGGLPHGLSKNDYLNKNISNLRNPIISNVFYRLNIIEQFGTGVKRIKEAYKTYETEPSFSISENYIIVILPVDNEIIRDLNINEDIIYKLLKKHNQLSRNEIDELTGFNKSKTIRNLNNLIDLNLVTKIGTGSSTEYRVKNKFQ